MIMMEITEATPENVAKIDRALAVAIEAKSLDSFRTFFAIRKKLMGPRAVNAELRGFSEPVLSLGSTPLVLAAKRDAVEIVRYLIAESAEVTLPNAANANASKSLTPRQSATYWGSVNVLTYLMDTYGIDDKDETLIHALDDSNKSDETRRVLISYLLNKGLYVWNVYDEKSIFHVWATVHVNGHLRKFQCFDDLMSARGPVDYQKQLAYRDDADHIAYTTPLLALLFSTIIYSDHYKENDSALNDLLELIDYLLLVKKLNPISLIPLGEHQNKTPLDILIDALHEYMGGAPGEIEIMAHILGTILLGNRELLSYRLIHQDCSLSEFLQKEDGTLKETLTQAESNAIPERRAARISLMEKLETLLPESNKARRFTSVASQLTLGVMTGRPAQPPPVAAHKPSSVTVPMPPPVPAAIAAIATVTAPAVVAVPAAAPAPVLSEQRSGRGMKRGMMTP